MSQTRYIIILDLLKYYFHIINLLKEEIRRNSTGIIACYFSLTREEKMGGKRRNRGKKNYSAPSFLKYKVNQRTISVTNQHLHQN